MGAPKLFLGCTDLADLLEVGRGYLDRAALYDLLATTDPAAVNGIAGECAFHYFHLAIVHEKRVTIAITPIVDSVALATVNVLLERPTGRQRRILKVPIRRRFPSSVADYATGPSFAARGTWIQCKVETAHVAESLPDVDGPGYLEIEACEIEYTPVTSSNVAGANK